MTYRVFRQSVKVIAVLYGFVGLIYIPLGFVIELTAPPEEQYGMWFWILFPVILAVMTFVAIAIGCTIYNAVAKRIRGIEVTLDAM